MANVIKMTMKTKVKKKQTKDKERQRQKRRERRAVQILKLPILLSEKRKNSKIMVIKNDYNNNNEKCLLS